MRRLLFLTILGSLLSAPSLATAQAFNAEQLILMRETAADICNSVSSTSGGTTRVEAEGNVSVELEGVFRRLADAGIDTAAKINDEQYDNLSREAVAAAVESDARCRERIFSMMFSQLTQLEKSELSIDPIANELCEFNSNYAEQIGDDWIEGINKIRTMRYCDQETLQLYEIQEVTYADGSLREWLPDFETARPVLQ